MGNKDFLTDCVYIYIYCHVIAHGDDRNKINTILPLEWTVATLQKSER